MITVFDTKYQSDKLVLVMPCEIGSNDRMHSHNYFEAVYIRKGVANHLLDDKSIKVSAGDFFIIDYGTKHMFEVEDGKSIEIVNVIFKPEMVDLSLKGCQSFEQLCQNFFIRLNVISSSGSYYFCKDQNEVLKNIITKMIFEFRDNSIGKNELLRSMLVELIIQAVRLSEDNKQYINYQPITAKIISSLEQRFMENITLSEISKETNYSVSFLSKTFKKDTGMGFKQYLDNIRLKQSEILLMRTDKKISEISLLVGFADINRFYKLFKDSYGVTPKKYRKKDT